LRSSGGRAAAGGSTFVVVADAAGPASTPERMRVAISGASGFVGTRLVAKLLAGGHEVRVLTRDVNAARKAIRPETLPSGAIIFVDPSQWSSAIVGATGVVNLAGEPISTRWSPAIKAEIMAGTPYKC
jgi:NAD dependent epimerase/dehydratase family enzyme